MSDQGVYMHICTHLCENVSLYKLFFSGHYIAHIRVPESGAWYKFNDEETEKMNNKKLELGKDDDVCM